MFRQISSRIRLPCNSRDLFEWDKRLYFPSEGRRAEDFFDPKKIRRLNPRTWVPKVSTLPLDHRSRTEIMGAKFSTKTRKNILIWVKTFSTSLASIREFKTWGQLQSKDTKRFTLCGNFLNYSLVYL
jgi:hypothetical protein